MGVGCWALHRMGSEHMASTRLLTGSARTPSPSAWGSRCPPAGAENRKVLAAKPEPCPSSLPLRPLVQVQAWGHLRAGVGLSRGCGHWGDVCGVGTGLGAVPRAGFPPLLPLCLELVPSRVCTLLGVFMCTCALGLLCDRCSCTMSPGSGPGVFWGGVCVTSPPHLDHGGWRVNRTGAWLIPGVWRGGRGEEQGKH